MSTELPNPEDQLHFLQKIQLLLEEGKFTSTYKYALLMALADLSVEYGDVGGNPLTLKVSVISQKLIEYYWRQTIPFPSHHAATLLLQNKGNQAAMINNIRLIHEQHSGSISRAIQDEQEWCALINGINGIVQEMPLWKLQTFSRGIDEFMYPNTGEGSEITLYPGVAYHLRSFHGLIHNMVQGAWTRWIRRLKQNQEILGQNINLDEFLFGEERSNLSNGVGPSQVVESMG